ncbi:nuclear transport factor 2 family protein [Mycobacterium ulcerans]|nr:nuclear transport factor 2 family protein [Mycobacterium ulcerans]
MSGPEFSRSELAAAFEKFEDTVVRAAASRDWDAWVQHYTPDVEYIEHAAGTMHGREQVRAWIWQTMTTFPGSHDDLSGQSHGGVPVVVVGHRRVHRTDHSGTGQPDARSG